MQGPHTPQDPGEPEPTDPGAGPRTPGWYPDAVGGSTAFRWWDGTQWTQAVSETLWESEPRHAPPYVSSRPGPPALATPPELELDDEPKRRPLFLGLAVTGGVLAACVLAVVLYGAFGGSGEASPSAGPARAAQEQQDKDDRNPDDGSEQDRKTGQGDSADDANETKGRKTGAEARLTFRQLPDQWWTGDESVVPHATVRHFTTEKNYSGKDDWIATIMTGEIPTEVEPAGELATTSRRVADWWAGIAFGPDREPNDTKLSGGPTLVDGRPAYKLRVRMPYQLDGLKATSDVVQIVVVDLGPDQRPGLFVAAVPNTDSSLWRTAENAFDSLSIRT